MATTCTAGLLDQSKRVMQCPKTSLSQRVQELQAAVELQGEGRKIFTESCEAKLNQKRKLLPPLREAVQADALALDIAQKRNTLPALKVCGAPNLDITLARKTVEEAKERLRSKIYEQVNQYNMVTDQLRQRSQAKEEMQKRLQWLQDITLDEKRQQEQLQAVRQLENDIAKMLTKVHAGEKVTNLYLVMRDVLRKELVYLSQTLDLLCGMAKLYQGELADKELTDLARARLPTGRRHQFPPLPKLVRLQNQLPQGDEHRSRKTDTKVKAITSQAAHEAWLTEQMEAAKAVVQCSHLWDIPGRLLAEQDSLGHLEDHYIEDCKEKKRVLKEKLKELELKQAELKFRQPPNRARVVEEELRMNLQREQAWLEEMRAQLLRNQELLIKFDNAIDNLFFYLDGITLPDREESIKDGRVKDKLQICTEKLQSLMERVASLPPDRQSLNKDSESFVKLRDVLEKTTANNLQNRKISLEDVDTEDRDPFDLDDSSHVPTRKDIKKQGLLLIKSKEKSKKKW